MKTMKQKQSGSGLIFAVVLLFVILGMVITLSSVTVLETKMSQKTKSSVGAFYNSESGVEWALNKIATGTGPNISDIFGASFSGGKVTCPAGFGCELYLLDDQGKVITSNLTIDQVKAVRSVGTQGAGGTADTQRAIEAAVADTASWCVQDIKITSATHDGNFGDYQSMYNWIQSNGCSGYHVCSGGDLACYYQSHSLDKSNEARGWYNSGVYLAWIGNPANDCLGWSDNSHSGFGSLWGGPNLPTVDWCNALRPVYCCK